MAHVKYTYIKDIVEGKEKSIFPIELFPNNMGINLNSVKGIKTVYENDGQIRLISIDFIPAIPTLKLHLVFTSQENDMSLFRLHLRILTHDNVLNSRNDFLNFIKKVYEIHYPKHDFNKVVNVNVYIDNYIESQYTPSTLPVWYHRMQGIFDFINGEIVNISEEEMVQKLIVKDEVEKMNEIIKKVEPMTVGTVWTLNANEIQKLNEKMESAIKIEKALKLDISRLEEQLAGEKKANKLKDEVIKTLDVEKKMINDAYIGARFQIKELQEKTEKLQGDISYLKDKLERSRLFGEAMKEKNEQLKKVSDKND